MADRSDKRRSRHDIIADILEDAKDGTRKTHIMYRVNLSYSQNERYLTALKKAGFISEENGVWKTTEKGLHVLEACKLCRRLCEVA